jgi:hypothetical protein
VCTVYVSLEPRPSGLGKAPALDVFGRKGGKQKPRARSDERVSDFRQRSCPNRQLPETAGNETRYMCDSPWRVHISSVLV